VYSFGTVLLAAHVQAVATLHDDEHCHGGENQESDKDFPHSDLQNLETFAKRPAGQALQPESMPQADWGINQSFA
jgi:hypothetical protein